MERRLRELDTKLIKLEKSVALWKFSCAVLVIINAATVIFIWSHWQELDKKPDFDHIGVSLTVFQTMFALAALWGFWTVRSLTKETAYDVAKDHMHQNATDVIEKYLNDVVPPMVARTTAEVIDKLTTGEISDGQAESIKDAMGDNGHDE